MSDTPPILDTPDCQNESQQLSEALEECIRSFTQEHQKLKSPKAAYLAKCLELEALSSTSDSSLPTSPLELRMFRTNAMEHGRILGKMRENMAKDQEAFEKAHNRAIDRLVDQLFFLLGPLLTERAKRGECSPSQSPQPEITLGQAIEDGDDRLPSSDSEHEQVVSPRKKQPKKTKTRKGTLRSRNIEFDDVYQDGEPDQPRAIVRYPENHGHFYILHCSRHDQFFDTLFNGASHLSHADHGGKRPSHRAVIQKLGVLVLGCSESLAKRNNALLGISPPHTGKRKSSSIQEHDPKRSRASSASSQRRRSNASENVRHAEETPARHQNQTATATTSSHRARRGEITPPPEKVYESILDPVPGDIYFCLVSETRSYVPVLLLPMENLEDVGIQGTLTSLGLMDDLPNAFVHNPETGKLDWAEGYDKKGKLAAKRAFPAIYLTSKKFPAGCPVAWVAAMNLRKWDLSSTSVPLRMNEHCEVLRYIMRQREEMMLPHRRQRSAESMDGAGEPIATNEAAGEATRADTPPAPGESFEAGASRGSSAAPGEIPRPPSRMDIEIIEILSSSESEDEIEEIAQPDPPSISQQHPDDAPVTDEPPAISREDADAEDAAESAVEKDAETPMDLAVVANEGPDEDGLMFTTTPSFVADEDLDASMDAALCIDDLSAANAPSPSPIDDQDIDDATTAATSVVAKKGDVESSKVASPQKVSNTLDDMTKTTSPSIDTARDSNGIEKLRPLGIHGSVDDVMESTIPPNAHRDADDFVEVAYTSVSHKDFDEAMDDASPLVLPDGDDDIMMDTSPPSTDSQGGANKVGVAPPLSHAPEDVNGLIRSSTPNAISSEDSSPFDKAVSPPVSDSLAQERVYDYLPADEKPSPPTSCSGSPSKPIQLNTTSTPTEDGTGTERSPSLFSKGSSNASQIRSPSLSHDGGIEAVDHRDFAFVKKKYVSPYIPLEKPAEGTHRPASTTSLSTKTEDRQKSLASPLVTVICLNESTLNNSEPEKPSMSCSRLESARNDVDKTRSEDVDRVSSKVTGETKRQPNTSAVRSRLSPATATTSDNPVLSSYKSFPVPPIKPEATKIGRPSNTKSAFTTKGQETRAPSPQTTTTYAKSPGSRVIPSIADILATDPDAPSTQHHSPRQSMDRTIPTGFPKILSGNALPELENVNTSRAICSPPSKHGFANILNHSPIDTNTAYINNRQESRINTSAPQNICESSLQQLAAQATEATVPQSEREHTAAHHPPVSESMGRTYTQRHDVPSCASHNRESSQSSMNSQPHGSGGHFASPANASCSPRLLQEEARQALEKIQSCTMQRNGSFGQHKQRHVAFQQGLPSPTPQTAGLAPQYAEARMERREPYEYRAPLSPTDSQHQFPSCTPFAFTSGRQQLPEPHAFSRGPEHGNQQSLAEVREIPSMRTSPPIHHHNSFTPHNHRAQQRTAPQAPTPEGGARMGPTPPSSDLGQGPGAHDLMWTAVSQAASSVPWLVTTPGGMQEQVQDPKRSGANDYKINIQSMRSALNTYVCNYCPSRNKKHYQTAGWMKKHLEQVHGVAARSMI
ncbi:unnamed protein product [Clonostachys rosea f. rosea IK726]|uniref:Uncharacterized protein n=1 Tax=Clonostachys rosea f. rosea IK726 TaxID=1349383 RepID=A0ACA9TP71_BIOOC|nr:unnamed protein product [Clonostachys rosea f. rosea IK726]